MKIKHLTILISTVLVTLIFADCKKKKDPAQEEEQDSAFDKRAMLTNYADNVIVPNLQEFKSSVDALTTAFNAFSQDKTTGKLADVREKYTAAYLSLQNILPFEFGPSEAEIIRSNFNTYPTDTAQVNSNIASGTYNLGTLNNLDAKGFPTIDFLLYGHNQTDASVIARFSTGTNAANRVAYMNACLNELQVKTNSVLNSWNSSYRTTFIASTGSQIGSSLGMMINQIDFEIDVLKNSKLGIPLGKKSLGVKLPEKCEAYYANTISVKLAKQCLANLENVYLGRSAAGADGKGIDDYLEFLKAEHGTTTLNAAIKNQFTVAKSKLDLVPEPLSATVVNNGAVVDAAYIEIVKLLVLLKTDTPSALGIVITYQDGDGD